jgi:hypothetical protein
MIWSDESSFVLFPASKRVYVWRRSKEAYNVECLVSTVKQNGGYVMVWAGISWYSDGPIITLHGQITPREYVDRLCNQVQPMIQILFLNNNVVFQDDSIPIHTAGTV